MYLLHKAKKKRKLFTLRPITHRGTIVAMDVYVHPYGTKLKKRYWKGYVHTHYQQ